MFGRDLATTAEFSQHECVVCVGVGPSRAQSGQVRPSQAAIACRTVDQRVPGFNVEYLSSSSVLEHSGPTKRRNRPLTAQTARSQVPSIHVAAVNTSMFTVNELPGWWAARSHWALHQAQPPAPSLTASECGLAAWACLLHVKSSPETVQERFTRLAQVKSSLVRFALSRRSSAVSFFLPNLSICCFYHFFSFSPSRALICFVQLGRTQLPSHTPTTQSTPTPPLHPVAVFP